MVLSREQVGEGEGSVCSKGNGRDWLRTLGALRGMRAQWGQKGPYRGENHRLLT